MGRELFCLLDLVVVLVSLFCNLVGQYFSLLHWFLSRLKICRVYNCLDNLVGTIVRPVLELN